MNNEDKRKEYLRLLHAMQAGVAKMQELDPRSTTAKHLRVGLNAQRSDQGALVELLIEKGIITIEELENKFLKYMQEEKKRYEEDIFNRTGIRHILEGRA